MSPKQRRRQHPPKLDYNPFGRQLPNSHAQKDISIIIMIMGILMVTLLLLLPISETDKNDFRPGWVALRVTVTWDENLDRAYALRPGETCPVRGSLDFDAVRRPPECSAADVDIWIQRRRPDGSAMVYSSLRQQADRLFSSTVDDLGSFNESQPTALRFEQLVTQFALLPQGQYAINLDLFRHDHFLGPAHPVRACAFVALYEGTPNEEVLFNGCVDLLVTQPDARERTVVRFAIGAENELVPGSVDHVSQMPIAGPYYAGRPRG
jgi:hypothetical protein